MKERTGFSQALYIRPELQRLEETWGIFFQAVQEKCPEVWEELREQVLPIYLGLNPQPFSLGYSNLSAGVEAIRSGWWDSGFNEQALALFNALEAWGQHWYLSHPYVFDKALQLCSIWKHSQDPEGRVPDWVHGDFHEVLGGIFRMELEGWSPNLETEAIFRKRALTAFKTALEQHIREILGDIEQHNQQPQEKPWDEQSPRRKLKEHAVWLVLRQCRGLGSAELNRELGIKASPQTIHYAQDTLAKTLGIKLRPV